MGLARLTLVIVVTVVITTTVLAGVYLALTSSNQSSKGGFASATYPVIFSETGLQLSANWSVTLADVTRFSNSSTVLFTEPSGSYPFTVGTIHGYTTNPSSGTVAVGGSGANSVIGTVNLGHNPAGITYDPENGDLYVTNPNSGTVSVLNRSGILVGTFAINGSTLVNGFTVGPSPYGIAYDPRNGYVYITNSNSSLISVAKGLSLVATIRSTSAQLTGFLNVEYSSYGIAYDPGNGHIYVTHPLSNIISVVDGLGVIENITVPKYLSQIAYNPANGYMYATGENSTIYVISGSKLIGNITVGTTIPTYGYGLTYDAVNGYMYATFPSQNRVFLIDGLKVVGNISGVLGPWGITYDPVNGYAYVADYGYVSNGNEVSVINGTKVLGNITVGLAPWGIAADPSTGYVYVTNFQSRSISIISSGAVVTKIVFSPPAQIVYSIAFMSGILILNETRDRCQIQTWKVMK